MEFQTMGRRRPLSKLMFEVASLTWMASTVVIDSAKYLLTISSPDIDNVAMSLYLARFAEPLAKTLKNSNSDVSTTYGCLHQ